MLIHSSRLLLQGVYDSIYKSINPNGRNVEITFQNVLYLRSTYCFVFYLDMLLMNYLNILFEDDAKSKHIDGILMSPCHYHYTM